MPSLPIKHIAMNIIAQHLNPSSHRVEIYCQLEYEGPHYPIIDEDEDGPIFADESDGITQYLQWRVNCLDCGAMLATQIAHIPGMQLLEADTTVVRQLVTILPHTTL